MEERPLICVSFVKRTPSESIHSGSANDQIIAILRFFLRAQRSSKFRLIVHLTVFGTPFAFYNLCGPSDLPTVVNSQQE